MSNAMVNIQEQIKKELEQIRKRVPAPSGRTISTRGKVFALPDGRTSQGPLEAVILDFRNYNRLYKSTYNPQDPKPPECFALGEDIQLLAPHTDSKEPQSDSCKECLHNKWGSAPTGRGKACRNTVRLAIAPPDASADDEPMLISVSPTGLTSWGAHASGLEAMGMLPIQVITQISFDANQSYPTLRFKALGPHDELEKFWALREKAQVMLDQPPASD